MSLKYESASEPLQMSLLLMVQRWACVGGLGLGVKVVGERRTLDPSWSVFRV